jgi:hypothetical protein
MAYYYMPAMEAREFANWAADALRRAGWNVQIEIQLRGEAHTVVRGAIDRYKQTELDAATAQAQELAAIIRVE